MMSVLNGWRLTRMGVLFIVGLLVLAGLVAGGVYLVHQRGEQARRDEAVKLAEQQLQDQSQVATNTDEKGENQGAVSEPDDSKASDDKKSEDKKDEKPAKVLPETGTELNQVFIVTILALSVAFYVTSRRTVRATLDL